MVWSYYWQVGLRIGVKVQKLGLYGSGLVHILSLLLRDGHRRRLDWRLGNGLLNPSVDSVYLLLRYVSTSNIL